MPEVPEQFAFDDELRQSAENGNEIIAGLRAIRKPRVFIISGPSGVGKDTVLERLQERYQEAVYVVTATTRPRRDNEIDGTHYLFYSREAFLAGIERGEFLEHSEVYQHHLYGVPQASVAAGLARNQDVIIKVDVNGQKKLRQNIANTTSIFIAPESTGALYRWLKNRKTETKEELRKRFLTAADELNCAREFDYVVFNEDRRPEECVRQICEIIESEGCKVNPPDVTIKDA